VTTTPTVGEYCHDLMLEALAVCTDRQRTAYQLVHGITVAGVHSAPCTVTEAARIMDLPRQNVDTYLAQARATVYERVCRSLIIRLKTLEADHEVPVPGMGTDLDHDDTRFVTHYGVRTEQRITLGPGSRAMELADKYSRRADARSATIRAHQTYTARSDA
jgi:hypothetical protein